MKKMIFTITLALFTVSSAVFAQSDKEELDLVQSVFGMEKKALVAEFIQPEGIKGDIFWDLYDQYETSRKELGRNRLALLQKYVSNYNTMDEQTADDILKDMMKLQTSTDNLITSYTKKIKKKVDAKTAAQFYQLEGYILSKIRTRIFENIPIIGEWDND